MATILIKGKPFEYEEEILQIVDLEPIKEEDAKALLELTKRLLDARGIDFFLFWGTLLGAVREKGLIPGDEDVDVATMYEEKLVEAIPYLYENGLKIIRHRSGHLYSFRNNDNCYIDFYIVRPLHHSLWSLWCYHAGSYVMEKKHFKKFKEIDFLGGKYLVPADTDAMLVRLYGKTWRTPQKGHLWHSDVTSHYIWNTYLIPYTRHYFCEIIGWKYWQHLLRKNSMSKEDYIKMSDENWVKYKKSLKNRKK